MLVTDNLFNNTVMVLFPCNNYTTL